MEQFLLQEAEKEARSRDIKTIITNFQERVSKNYNKKKIFLNNNIFLLIRILKK